MIHWEAHTCLRLHPQASFAPIDRLRAAGVHYVSINVGMDMNPLGQVMSVLAGFRATIAAYPDKYLLVSGVADIERARASGRIAIGFDLEGAMPLLEQPAMVMLFASLGVRQIHFAYNRNNSVADGCHDVPRGLTPLGQRMVAAVNGAGLLLDCSHSGRRCSLEIMNASCQPVIFSHANPLALCAHDRNITDEQIRACAATGGVICVSGLALFLGCATPSAAAVARHAAYVADLVGIEHVGIGLDISFPEPGLNDRPSGDYDPDYWWPKSAGYEGALSSIYPSVETWHVLGPALEATGMTGDEVSLVLGGNMLKVAQQVWHAEFPVSRLRNPGNLSMQKE